MLGDSAENTRPPAVNAAAIDPDTSLAAAPEAYLIALHGGCTLMLVAFAASFVITLPCTVVFVILGLTQQLTHFMPALVVGMGLVMLIVGCIGWAGQYLLTVPDPRGVWNVTFENYRRVLRIFLWAGVILALIGLGFAFTAWNSFLASSPASSGTSMPVSGAVSPFGLGFFARIGVNVVSFVVGLVHVVFLMLFFEQIGLRLNDPWIAARAKLPVWLAPVLMVLFCTIIGPLAGAVLQAHLFWRVRGRIGEVMGKGSGAGA